MTDKPASYVAEINTTQGEKLLKDLKHQGFEISQPPYTVFQGKKKGVNCTYYSSGKLVVQGKGSAEFIEFYLEPELLGSFKYGYGILDVDKTPRIGVDEAGKGDFFGPLCIAGVYAGEKEIDALLKLGVKDSKTLQDSSIGKMAQKIKANVPYHVVRISPQKYNEIYPQFGNLNLLLAWGHATVIENLVKETGCRLALIDQFSKAPLVQNAVKRKKIEINVTQRTKAESDPVVAAASILARDAFVTGLDNLSKEIGVKLPKGASAHVVQAGYKILKELGRDVLEHAGKKHFKTLDEILRKS